MICLAQAGLHKILMFRKLHSTARCGLIAVTLLLAVACSQQVPFGVAEGLFESDEVSMADFEEYPGAETFTVFRAEEGMDLYANGAVLTKFQGRFYCMWQASARDEDSPDTHLVYAVSDDLAHWSAPMDLASGSVPMDLASANTCPSEEHPCHSERLPCHSERSEGIYYTSGGWWNAGDSRIAYVNIWPEGLEPRGGEAWYRASADGVAWSPMRPVRMADGDPLPGVLEQDPHWFGDRPGDPFANRDEKRFGDRIVGAAHFQPGLQVCPIFTDIPDGVTGWRKAAFETTPFKEQTRELEPSVFQRGDGVLVMVFRDQESSFKKLAAVSIDRGETWSNAVETAFPDSRSKQCAGNLLDGTPFLIGNPGPEKDRSLLILATASDGKTFDCAWTLRKDPPERRFEGKAKTLGFSYPKAFVDKDYLYVAYSVNKEEIAVTRLPVNSADGRSGRP